MKIEVARLDSLFVALRGAGLVVGVEEVVRCRQVLAVWGQDGAELSEDRLRNLLAFVVIKDNAKRPAFDRAFDLWLETSVVERHAQLPAPPPREGEFFLGMLLLFVAVLALLSTRLAPQPFELEAWRGKPTVAEEIAWVPEPEPRQTLVEVERKPEETPKESRAAEERPKTRPAVLPRNPEAPWPSWPELMIGLALLAWTAKTAVDLEGRTFLPHSGPPQRVEGLTRLLLSPPKVDLSLLKPEEREAIVWSLGRFVSEEKTLRIDLRSTVKATAKAAGQIELRYVPRSWHREVWLWLDESANDPQLRRVADEVEEVLRPYGLPVERAYFRGVPDNLWSADGKRFRPREIEERRGETQVAVLTDGRLLGRCLDGHEGQRIAAIFRELGGWPRLALFMPKAASKKVWDLALQHQLEVRQPPALASFLSASRRQSGDLDRDVAVWAAACALSPAPIDPATAEALRQRLEIETHPWQLAELRKESNEAAGGRLEWPENLRRDRVEWLREAELGGGHFKVALSFWLELYRTELNRLRHEPMFAGTLAEAQLEAERAMLLLLERRKESHAEAIERLFEWHQSEPALRANLESRLAALDTADGSPDFLRLDFGWKELSAVQQQQLTVMRLGGRQVESRLRVPRRSGSFLAGAAGLGAGALLVAAWPSGEPGAPVSVEVEIHLEIPPAHEGQGATPESGEVARDQLSEEAKDNPIEVAQNEPPKAAEGESGEITTDKSEVDQVGLSKGIQTEFAEAQSESSVAQDGSLELTKSGLSSVAQDGSLAISHSGSADSLLTSSEGPPGASWVISEEPPWATSTGGTLGRTSEGAQSSSSERAQVESTIVDREEPIGLDLQVQPSGEKDGWGIEMVRIPAGKFWMGRRADDPDYPTQKVENEILFSDEQPAHEVMLKEFWMDRFEVTHEQFRKFLPRFKTSWDQKLAAASRLPVTDVDWYEAADFCKARGGRLPTEAEWEYAARAGTRTPWSFGTNVAELGQYAWFDENSKGQPHEVGGQKPNAWGLYDMLGNVWEWTATVYAPYLPGPLTDPPSSYFGKGGEGVGRGYYWYEVERSVVRGGAYWNVPWGLRSAFRFWYGTEDRLSVVGFRCVRNSRPSR